MTMFPGATHVAIAGGTYVTAGAGGSVTINQGGLPGINSAFQILSSNAAHTALHNSSARFNAPRCHRNTRTTYLDAFERWLLGHGEEYVSARLIWLTGGAGAGKSAIMQSIVERCAKDAVILGTFFFSRTDASRNYAEVLIPTLAYQLARKYPAAMALLKPIIQQDPLIFKASLETQAHELLVRPLLYLLEHRIIDTTSPLRRVFVIDGLDECSDPQKQALIIHVVGTILCNHYVPICFLISSRPEMAISRAFQRETQIHSMLTSVTLDNNDEASSDIRQFIEDSFLDILDTHPLRANIPPNWPEPYSVNQLVDKSSGHFIYAATAMKFISSADEHPSRALQVVEGIVPPRMGNPFPELDALYSHILTSAKYSSQVLAILRHCIFTCFDNSVRAVCFMYPDISPEDIALFLADVQALVSFAPDDAGEMRVTLKHASLGDFFRDANRSGTVYMYYGGYRASLLPRYFRLFDTCYHIRAAPFFSESQHYLLFTLMSEFADAILHLQDIEFLQSLIDEQTLQNIWIFYRGCKSQSDCDSRETAVYQVSHYLRAIRDSAANYGNTLYIYQFKMFIDVLMHDLNDLILSEPQYRLIPALLFSSSARALALVVPLLIECLNRIDINLGYSQIFWCLRPREGIDDDGAGGIDPRSYEAIRSLPQAQLSWSSDLTTALGHVLRELMAYLWTPECLCSNMHQRWLRRMKPLKHISQGSPRLSSNVYLHIRRLPTPWTSPRVIISESMTFERCGYNKRRAGDIGWERKQCFVLLRAVVCYLHKCDCTSELAKLARRSLPKATLWFPKLLKRARAKMDAYVVRWEESPDGLLEKAQSLSINDMD